MSRNSPIGFILATLSAASIIPFAKFLEIIATPGDGFVGAGAMILFLAVAAILTIGGIIVGFLRKERHWWLAVVAVVLWLLPLQMMF